MRGGEVAAQRRCSAVGQFSLLAPNFPLPLGPLACLLAALSALSVLRHVYCAVHLLMIACLYIPLHTCDDARTITMVKERWQLAHRLLGRRTSRHQQGPGHAGLTASSFLSSTLSCICLLLLHPATLHLPRRPALQYCCSAQCHHTQPTPAAAAGIRSPCCISGGRASAVHSGAQNLQQGWHGRRRVLEQAGTCVQLMWKESIFPAELPNHASQPRYHTCRQCCPGPPTPAMQAPTTAALTSPLPVNTSTAEPSMSTLSRTRPCSSTAGAARGPPRRRVGAAAAASASAATASSTAAAAGSGSASAASWASIACSAAADTAAAAGLPGGEPSQAACTADAADAAGAACPACPAGGCPALRGLMPAAGRGRCRLAAGAAVGEPAGLSRVKARGVGAGTPNVTSSALVGQL